MCTIIDGKALAAQTRAEVAEGVKNFRQTQGRTPVLAVVLVGDDPASQVYVRNKIKACAEVGIQSDNYTLPAHARQDEVERLVKNLAEAEEVDGILVQLPLPKHLDSARVLALIPAAKDVDGFFEENIGKLSKNERCLVACTPNGVMRMLERYNIGVRGKRAVVLGRSNIVGKPMAMLLLNADATVTVCHSKTADLKEECARADILIAAIGKPKFVTADMVKAGATVIDVGMNRDENGKLCGDVDFERVKDKCSFITPVPGGVGPMTIAMLMYNTLAAAKERCRG